jgi:hypothetical protein
MASEKKTLSWNDVYGYASKIVPVIGTAVACYYGLISKIDRIESKMDKIVVYADADKIVWNNRLETIEAGGRDLKNKVNEHDKEINRIFAILPKQVKREEYE